MLPSSTDIEYFVEVAKTLNFSRASERLGLSQPSISLAIQRLESSLGTSLFHRSRKGVQLTQGGKQLLAHSKFLLQTWEEIKRKTLSSTSEIEGSFTLGCHPSVALCFISQFLPKLMKDNPKLEIKLKHDLSRKILEHVVSSTIDIGIVVNPTRHPDLILQKLCEDTVTLWSLEKKHIDDLDPKQDVLLFDPELMQVDSILKQMKKMGLEFHRTIHSSSLEVISDLTRQGGGMGILPSRVAQKIQKPLVSRVEGAPTYTDEIYLAFRMESRGLKSIQVISKAVQSVFKPVL